jgi:UDP-N-acetylmuramyl pentapeptide phosphotransferase/UDP-N-acetylglucosamine-1-phosphate transferase
MNDTFQKIFLMIFITFMFVACIIPFIKRIAIKVNAIDVPRGRHKHKKITPKFGGIAVFLGFLLGYMIFGTPSSIMNAILIGSFIIILTGALDDVMELGALSKLIGQIAAASVIVFYGKILMQDISAFGIYLDFGILAYPITLIFIVACINCINLIDGLDGLSGGISAIYFLTIGIIATLQGKFGLDFVIAFIMFGSILGFLVHNFSPATIFAGDSGAMFFGFIISVVALLGFKNVTLTSLIIPLLVLAIPILDTLFAIIRRSIKGEKIMVGDRYHIHHQFLNRNLSEKTTVLIIYIIDLLFAFASIVYVLKDEVLSYFIYGILLVIVFAFVLKTNVIADKETLKSKIAKKLRRK